MTDRDLELRLSKPQDLPLIQSIFEDTLSTAHSVTLPEGFKITRHHLNNNSLFSTPSFLTLQLSNQPVGFMYHHYTKRCRTAWIAAGLLKNRRKQGIGTMGVRKYLNFLFDHLPIDRIEAGAPVPNIPSNKTLLKLGFRLEGIQRHAVLIKSRHYDYNLYGILRTELKKP